MKLLVLIVSSVLFSVAGIAQQPNAKYDSTLAKKLKGNDMGMKRYVLVILKTGTNTNTDKATQDNLFAGHMKNIGRLADEGLLVLAGPLGKNEKNYRGIFIMNVETIDEAKKLVLTDPAVKANLLDADYYSYFGSAAIQEISELHKKIQKFQ
jgi:uncharacterized protein